MLLDCAITSFTGSQPKAGFLVVVQLAATIIEVAVLAEDLRVEIDRALVDRPASVMILKTEPGSTASVMQRLRTFSGL